MIFLNAVRQFEAKPINEMKKKKGRNPEEKTKEIQQHKQIPPFQIKPINIYTLFHQIQTQ
jgi:hypothetical protein